MKVCSCGVEWPKEACNIVDLIFEPIHKAGSISLGFGRIEFPRIDCGFLRCRIRPLLTEVSESILFFLFIPSELFLRFTLVAEGVIRLKGICGKLFGRKNWQKCRNLFDCEEAALFDFHQLSSNTQGIICITVI